MTDYVEYKPPANGVAPRGWVYGMKGKCGLAATSLPKRPQWNYGLLYHVPPAALHYPIAPYEGDWGADIAVNGRPEWLPDGQVFALKDCGHWIGLGVIRSGWGWHKGVTKIRLPASHGYYADNGASEYRTTADAYDTGGMGIKYIYPKNPELFNLDTWLSETKANLPAIEAAGHNVAFAPDWAEQLWEDLYERGFLKSKESLIDLIRSRVRPMI